MPVPQQEFEIPLNIMVVDDSALTRQLVVGILGSIKNLKIIAEATNGQEAIDFLEKNPNLPIDIITLDIMMPLMDGLVALPKILSLRPHTKVIISTGLGARDASLSVKALNQGATDYLVKPDPAEGKIGMERFREELRQKVTVLGSNSASYKKRASLTIKTYSSLPDVEHIPVPATGNHGVEVIAIASSTGGPQALSKIFDDLTNANFRVPVLITQHMPANFTSMLAEQLKVKLKRADVREAKDGEHILPGKIYIAPGDYHMLAVSENGRNVIRLNKDAPVNFCRPSADPMIESLVKLYKSKILVVVLTGMGSDGLNGSKKACETGAVILAQDSKTSVVWGMPGAVANAGLCKEILPIDNMAEALIKHSMGGVTR